MNTVIREDRSAALAAPITGTLYEGKAGSIHDESDPLVYSDGVEYRTLDEVESIAKQLAGKPFTLLHPDGLISDGAEADIAGYVVAGRVDNGYAVATIMVTSKTGLDAIQSGTFALSLGYKCVLDASKHQRQVSVDHLALVPVPRCKSCFLRADASAECAHQEKTMKVGTLEVEVKVTGLDELKAVVDAMSASAIENLVSTVEKTETEIKADAVSATCACNSHTIPHTNGDTMSNTNDLAAEMAALNEKLEAANKALTALEIEATNARKDADKAKSELEAAQAEIVAAKSSAEEAVAKVKSDAAEALTNEIQTRVDARVALLVEAKAVLPADSDINKLSDREIKCAVVKHIDGDEIAADKVDAFVDGVYTGALKRGAGAGASRDAARVAIKEMRNDGVKSPVELEKAAKENMKRASANAWVTK